MADVATLPMWLLERERHHGSIRRAAEAHGIDPGYWYRLRQGEKTAPSAEMLERLGLKVIAVLYAKDEPK